MGFSVDWTIADGGITIPSTHSRRAAPEPPSPYLLTASHAALCALDLSFPTWGRARHVALAHAARPRLVCCCPATDSVFLDFADGRLGGSWGAAHRGLADRPIFRRRGPPTSTPTALRDARPPRPAGWGGGGVCRGKGMPDRPLPRYQLTCVQGDYSEAATRCAGPASTRLSARHVHLPILSAVYSRTNKHYNRIPRLT